jgi:serine protease Do
MRKRLLLYIIIIIFVMLCSCNKEKQDKHIADALESVVEISVYESDETISVGTGVCVDDGEKILFAAHIFDYETINDYVIKCETIDGICYILSVIKVDKEKDLALLQIDGGKLNPIVMSDTEAYWADDVFVIGNSCGLGLNVSKASVSCPLKRITINCAVFEMMQINITVNEGDSGGPVLNSDNELVGLISFKLKDYTGTSVSDMSYSILLSDIKVFMNYTANN